MGRSSNKRKPSTNAQKSGQGTLSTFKRIKNTMTSNDKESLPNMTEIRPGRFKGDQNQLVEEISPGEENRTCNKCHKYNKSTSEIKACQCTVISGLNLPHWLPWLLVTVTLCLRVRYVTQPSNWWLLHPDEVYQTIEVAHTEAYGYGFLPYEYLPPPGNDVTNTTLSAARAQEIRLGMFSLRSYLLPKLLYFILTLAETVGVSWSPYLVIKTFHVIVTSFLPLAVYRFTKACYSSRDTGILAAIFVSSSLCLNVFGTHTLSNSFVSPFLFFTLEPLVKILMSMDTSAKLKANDLEYHNGTNGTTVHTYYNQKGHDKLYDINGNCGSNLQNVKSKPNDKEGNYGKYKNQLRKVTFNHLYSPVTFYQLLCGALLACCVYIRIDAVAIPVILVASNLDSFTLNVLKLINKSKYYVTGGVLGLLFGGYVDHVTYGALFLSPVQWFKFNVLSQTSGAIFGVSPNLYYIKKVFDVEPFLLAVIGLTLLGFLAETYCENRKQHKSRSTSHEFKCTVRTIVLFIVLVTIYSSNRHKELRFVHNTIVIMYILLARAICCLIKTIDKFTRNQNCNQHYTYCVYAFIALFMSSHLYEFYTISKSNNKRIKWSYGGSYDSDHVNVCLDFIRQQDDVTGLFLDRPIHMTGGYSIVHKDIPMFALNKYEFMGFDEGSRLTIGYSRDLSTIYSGIVFKRVNIFGRVSEFISIYNTAYLFRQLLVKKQYNYLILLKDRQIENIGYTEVFETGNSRVLKRINDPHTEELMANASSRIPIGSNATILEYEGDWLVHFGLHGKAEQRLLLANRLDPQRIGPFRILLSMYRKLDVVDSYERVLEACRQLHLLKECLKPYTPIKLHPDYYRRSTPDNL